MAVSPLDPLVISSEQGEALLHRLEQQQLTGEDYQILARLLKSYFWLAHAVKEAKMSIHRLKGMLFGEGKRKSSRSPRGDAPEAAAPTATEAAALPTADNADEKAAVGVDDNALPMAPAAAKRIPGHGRLSAEDYPGARLEACAHDTLKAGQRCPLCDRGRLYALPPGVTLSIDGRPPLQATRYEYERLRCAACGAVLAASLPPHALEKYTPLAKAIVTIIHYGLGVPFQRLEDFQRFMGVPLPDATQWELVESVADCSYQVFEHLLYKIAQAALIYQDDTGVRILTLMRENQADPAPARTGMFTTGLVAEVEGHRIVIYLSGRAHAGENMGEVLKRREPNLPPLRKMSDALSANRAKQPPTACPTIDLHCNAHGIRKFTEIEHFFPNECAVVLRHLRAVYHHEHQAQEQQLNAAQRLAYHQAHSAPEMVTLKAWIENQFETRAIESHSSFGQACRYLLKHWQALTAFLRLEGVPLDNNLVERLLKKMILLRKNSLFFASEHGAYVGSMLVSLIATCQAAQVNPVDYFVALQDHRTAALRTPEHWLPWNYHEQLTPTSSRAA